MPAALKQAEKDGARKVAAGLTATARRTTAAAAPGGRLNVGKRGARIGVRYDVRGNGEAIVRATGPYQLIERDTSGHVEPKGRRRGRSKVLHIPGIGFRRTVRHPGTKGKHPFERAVREYTPKAPKVFQREVAQAMRKTFG